MKSRGTKVLFIGAALAIMAFVVVYIVMSRGLIGGTAATTPDASVPEGPKMVTVAVVNRDVPAYTVLDASTVATTDVEESTVAPNTTTEPSTLYGKMTLVPLTKGQQVHTDQLTATGFSDILAKGERAFSLAIPERNTFANAVTENDHVDLIWSTVLEYKRQVPSGEDGKLTWETASFTSTKTLLQDVHVMRVVKLLQAPPPSNQNSGNGNAEAASAVSTDNSASLAAMYAEGAPYATVLVLGVTDQQAEVIAYARDNGTIDLTLRSSAVQKDDTGNVVKDDQGQDVRGDKEVEKTTGIGIDTLVQQYGLPVPKTTGP